TYRLHRRLLRTRREDPRVRDFLPSRTGPIVVNHEDHARAEAFDFLEAWRIASTMGRATQSERHTSESLFGIWVDSALSHPRVLPGRIAARLALRSGAKAGIPPDEKDLLSTPWAFEGEQDLLRERLALLLGSVEPEARALRLAEWLGANRDVAKTI